MIKVIYNGENDSKALAKEVLAPVVAEMAAADPDVIWLDADLMNCSGTLKWANAHPEQAVNVGIAEANMAGVAAGLALTGFKPFIHSFGTFSSRRCYDQVFLSGGYAKCDMTVIGTDPGVTAAFNGGTHMPFEDMAMYRALPGCTVLDIADSAQLTSVLWQCKDRPGVKYIRMNRKNNLRVYEDGSEFEIGKGVVAKDGADVAIIACGHMVGHSMAAAEALAAEGINAAVIDMFTVKPLDEELVLEYAEKCGCVVTVENHNKIGGLTSAVSECLCLKRPTPVEHVAIEDVFGQVGPMTFLEKAYDLTPEHIVAAAKAAIARK